MKHTLSVLVENKPGVLARVAGLFSRRGFNIDSLAVGVTEKPEISRMTVVVDVEEHSLEQVYKQLNKLINVIKVIDLPDANSVQRELVLVKVKAEPRNRAEIIEIVEIFRGKIVDVGKGTLSVEVTGPGSKLSAFEELLRPYGVEELVRTGTIALPRG
ncbi:MAG: acetolactate synthase small subunit [Actinobacteria bacterium]|nr:acetolactate synthase small subunit [Actinomycetota bacterium]MBU1944110.1 acetolactate synthase small subunit [Actinomycetota bacterium]MBU2687030.1 acetolactate synthase small subunit [Actinomycetota bacterium]